MKHIQEQIKRLCAARDLAERSRDKERTQLDLALARYEDSQEAQRIMQELARSVQERVQQQIAGLVSRCLRDVFGKEAPEMRIRFEEKRGKTEAVLLFVKDGLEMDDPPNQASGGQLDVASFALRISTALLQQPRGRLFMVFDEPFKHVSASVAARLRVLLYDLSRELDIQFLLVTHTPTLRAGRVIDWRSLS